MGLLCALTLAFYRRIALTDLVLPGVDAFAYFYPYRAYAAQAIRSGQIPLWNPYLFLGVPLVANAQSAVFYPLNLALCWLPAPRLIAWSIVLHVALAALFSYLYARHARLSPLPAFLGASAFAFGGFVSGQVEHVNQLNVSAWFPLLLLLWDLAVRGGEYRASGEYGASPLRGDGRRPKVRWPVLLGMGGVIGAGLLAGHAQSSYVSLVGLGVYALLPALPDLWRVLRRGEHGASGEHRASPLRRGVRRLGAVVLWLGVAGLVGVGLAAVQILPTVELSRLSIRGGGLEYREAVAFSLRPLPRLLRYTFLPPWGGNLGDAFGGDFYTEYLAYLGLVPLLLGVGWLGSWVVRRLGSLGVWGLGGGNSSLCEVKVGSPEFRVFVLAALGVFLALGLYNPLYYVLYKIVPGFALFRAPARWLFLYAFGMAMLAGAGLERLQGWLSRRLGGHRGPPLPWRATAEGLPYPGARPAIGVAVTAVVLAELFAASEALPLNHLTAPGAYTSLRTAPAHILAAQRQQIAPGRVLSMSDILFDPGDLGEIRHMFRGQLSEKATYDYVVCAKRKEILAPNLPLAWRIYAVDGYDGGVLPLARYVHLQRLFLDPDAVSPDGRLREQLDRIPPSRLLSLLGVRYVITDKLHDAWIEDVFYDLAFDAVLGVEAAPSAATADIPSFTATSLGVVFTLEGGPPAADGEPLAEVRLETKGGETYTFVLSASPQQVGDSGYSTTRLRWGTPAQIARVEIAALPFGGRVRVRGLTLIDERDGSNASLLLSTTGRFRQVHSGDVKIYEVLDALPRAYVVHRTRVIDDDQAALAAMADPAFDPAQVAILAAGQEIDAAPRAAPQVTVAAYAPQAIALRASLQAPGYLVLSDAWYPGWRATVDGKPAAIERANVHFRAVYLGAGTHTVRFTYRPASYFAGLGISLATVAGLGIGIAAALTRRPGIADV